MHTKTEYAEYDNPLCPLCGEYMTRTHYQNEEGDWFVCWLCECLPDARIIGVEEALRAKKVGELKRQLEAARDLLRCYTTMMQAKQE